MIVLRFVDVPVDNWTHVDLKADILSRFKVLVSDFHQSEIPIHRDQLNHSEQQEIDQNALCSEQVVGGQQFFFRKTEQESVTVVDP